jgi:hypothetical protein
VRMAVIGRLMFAALLGAAISAVSLLSRFDFAAAKTSKIQYQNLPADLRDYVDEVRQRCKSLDPKFLPYDRMDGIMQVDLDGDQSQDFIVDAEHLCNEWIKGANCTNRGCDLKVWKQVDAQSWKVIFSDHVYRKFISISDDGRFQLMTVSVYAGSPLCARDSSKSYTSGQSCDLIVSRNDNNWTVKTLK